WMKAKHFGYTHQMAYDFAEIDEANTDYAVRCSVRYG
ncbi:MAG: hypothetical protein K0Q73_8092, partial [Paenibacillus sp.]|nr:hypothetical protein [Paenibacillus sp.]